MSPALIGRRVRVYFGAGETREGVIEHIGKSDLCDEDAYYVRINPGWLHLCGESDFLVLPQQVAA